MLWGPLRECDSIGLTFCRCYCVSMVLVVVCRVISQRHYESTVRYNHLTVSVRNISLSCSTVSAWRTTIPVFSSSSFAIFRCRNLHNQWEGWSRKRRKRKEKKTGKFSQTAQIAVARTSPTTTATTTTVNSRSTRWKIEQNFDCTQSRRLNNYNR